MDNIKHEAKEENSRKPGDRLCLTGEEQEAQLGSESWPELQLHHSKMLKATCQKMISENECPQTSFPESLHPDLPFLGS
jgi:hypothetical protein